MSWWTYVKGAIEVDVPGRTQAEIRYILETVLDHLPRVTGSEKDMNVYISQEAGHNCSSSFDEFMQKSNNHDYGQFSIYSIQSKYMLAIEGDLRDRNFEQIKREFIKWLCRLSKRLRICSVVVKISDYDREFIISDEEPFDVMYERYNWHKGEKCWTDYLFWERDPKSGMPLKLVNKYYKDEDINSEIKRREEWRKSLD